MGKRRHGPGSNRLAMIALVGGGLALLLWAKLRLVTEVPRAAYATPDSEASSPVPGPDADSPNRTSPDPSTATRSGDADEHPDPSPPHPGQR